jgi:hypothetical protein
MIKLFSTAIIVGVLSTGAAFAADPSDSSTSPMATTSTAQPEITNYTESQARDRVKNQGYAEIGDLTQDNQMAWHGTAEKDGKRINFSLGTDGKIVTN